MTYSKDHIVFDKEDFARAPSYIEEALSVVTNYVDAERARAGKRNPVAVVVTDEHPLYLAISGVVNDFWDEKVILWAEVLIRQLPVKPQHVLRDRMQDALREHETKVGHILHGKEYAEWVSEYYKNLKL